jgi:8-oxo-dGTP pyrophosphatase MutT (NUDIX family)
VNKLLIDRFLRQKWALLRHFGTCLTDLDRVAANPFYRQAGFRRDIRIVVQQAHHDVHRGAAQFPGGLADSGNPRLGKIGIVGVIEAD